MADHARLHRMSMYSELLGASLRSLPAGDDPGDRESERALLGQAARARRRLHEGRVSAGFGGAGPADATADIACQIDYDLALIRLCWLHGIRCDPAGFTRPANERSRLERALAEVGVDVAAAEHRRGP